jgi:hypothetical protein
MLKKLGTGLAIVGTMTATATGAYLLFVGPWQRRWGATDEEVTLTPPRLMVKWIQATTRKDNSLPERASNLRVL